MRIPKCILLFIVLFLQQVSTIGQQADLILFNGKIFTSDPAQLYVQAVAISGNKILATGTNERVERFGSSKTEKIDLGGKTVIPGFNDAHNHPGWEAVIGKSYSYTGYLQEGPAKAAVLDSVRMLVKGARPGEWIYGLIGTSIFFDSSMRSALDSIAPNNPVSLQIWWGHGLTVNRKALEASGLSDSDTDPVGGWFIRNSSNLISSLQQNAQAPVWTARYKSDPSALVVGMQSYSSSQLKRGVTTVQYMGTGLNKTEADAMLKASKLQQRVRIIAWPRSTSEGRQLNDWNVIETKPTTLSYLSGIKYVIDGSPGEQNALRSVPYPGKPGWYGRLNYPIDTLKQIFNEALETDRQLLMHITADSSFGIVLSLMKGMASAERWKAKRVRLEHNCVGEPGTGNMSQANRQILKELGIIVMHTPKYCMGSPLRTLLDSGVIVGIAPDGMENPFVDIMLINTAGGKPTENLTREQTVIAFTRTNAYAEFREKEKGTISKGMLADMAVLSQDIFTISAEELPATESLLTIIDGKIVYRKSVYGGGQK
ncbi:amidohydrolase [Flavitalea antarctica]